MIEILNNVKISVNIDPKELNHKIPILFLHGFTGSLNDWDYFIDKLPSQYSPICIDLLGHGKSDSPNKKSYYSFNSQIEIIKQLLKKYGIKKIIILGYSMGGRLALSFALAHPEMIAALVLESTSFGIENENERSERIETDKELADYIVNSHLNDFLDYWLDLPLFDSQKKLPSTQISNIKNFKTETSNKLGLSNTLLGFSTGQMGNYFPLLNKFEKETLLICGELDKKFTNIAEKANSYLPNSELLIFKDCGHNVHLENPEEFLKLLNKFLLNIRDK